jgi:hypothetical protein
VNASRRQPSGHSPRELPVKTDPMPTKRARWLLILASLALVLWIAVLLVLALQGTGT